jgi:hypothetical protein
VRPMTVVVVGEALDSFRARTKQDELEHAADQQGAERPEQEPTPRISRTGARRYGRHTYPRAATELTHPTGVQRAAETADLGARIVLVRTPCGPDDGRVKRVMVAK